MTSPDAGCCLLEVAIGGLPSGAGHDEGTFGQVQRDEFLARSERI